MKLASKALWLLVSFGTTMVQAQISQFQHIVIIVQENRTPDNLFQGLCAPPFGSADSCSATPNSSQYDILTSNWLDKNSPSGTTQPLPVPLAANYDLGHSHAAFLSMCNANPSKPSCQMNGAADIDCTGLCLAQPQFRYVDNSAGIVNPYLQLATQYGWANYMFQTNQGPSFPAHQFLFGGTSAPFPFADTDGYFAAENPIGPGYQAGCTAPEGTTVALTDPFGGESLSMYPCFEHMTLPDLLPPAITWKYYAPSAGSIWTAPNAIQHICQSTGPGGKCTSSEWQNNVDLTPANVLKDIKNCRLSSLSWVIPTGANSDHPRNSDGGGPSWVAAVVNAIGNSDTCDNNTGYWNNTAVLITWDDWGGWYDHESPPFLAPPQSDYQYGFRVPLIFVSAYTQAGNINPYNHDFGSILRFVEHNFGIEEGALNFADARADSDLNLFFDLSRQPRAFTTIPAPKDASFFLHDKRPPTDPDDQ